MAIKALKQNVSIREIQKMIHQWKAWGSQRLCLSEITGSLSGYAPFHE